MQPFATPDEEEELLGWLAAQAEGPGLDYAPDPVPAAPQAKPVAAATAPAAVPAMQMPDFSGMQAPQKQYVLPEPPMIEKPNTAMHVLAAFAALAGNKGIGGPQILQPLIDEPARQYENYNRQVQHAKDEAAINAPRHGQSPLAQELAWRRYMQSQQRLDADLKRRQEEEDQRKAESDPESEVSKRAVQTATEMFPALSEKFAGRSAAELKSSPTLRAAIQEEQDRRRGKEWDRQQTRRVGDQMDVIDYTEGKTIAREGRAEQADLRGEKRKNRVVFAKADADMDTLQQKLEDMIAQKGEDYRLPVQGGILQEYWTKGQSKLFGGSGMDFEDTDLVASVRGSALPDYIVVAQNAPNTEPERATAFEKWFSDGTLGGMLRFVKQQRGQNNKRLAAIVSTLDDGDSTPDATEGDFTVPGNLGVTRGTPPKVPQKPGKPKGKAAPTGGTITVRDPKTGKSAPVKDTPELRKRIAAGLLEVVE